MQAYAPYTQCPSGVALVSSSGGVYGGRYIESAAFNPSLPPLQAALINAVLNELPSYTQVGGPARCMRMPVPVPVPVYLLHSLRQPLQAGTLQCSRHMLRAQPVHCQCVHHRGWTGKSTHILPPTPCTPQHLPHTAVMQRTQHPALPR